MVSPPHGGRLTQVVQHSDRAAFAGYSKSQKIQVTNIGVTTYVISGLTSGTWYFAVTSYTSNGAQSVPSNVVSATIS